MEGLTDYGGQVVDFLHQIVILAAGPRDAHDIRLLESIIADEHGGHLPAKDHEGNGVHGGGGDSRHRVGGSGTRGHQGHTGLAACPGVSVRRVHRTLFVPGEDELNVLLVIEMVEDVEDHAARVAEDVLHALPFQALKKDFCTGFLHSCRCLMGDVACIVP
jgi:hypothetical protein